MSSINERINDRENVFAGIIGALLFSLAGGIIWFVLWQIGIIAGISGIIGVICAIKGYSVFAKKESIKGIVISIIATVVVMVIAWYFCLSMDVYDAYKEWYAEGYIDYTITFGEAVRGAYVYLEEPEIGPAYIKDLVIGLAFCIIGGVGYVMSAVKRVKAEKEFAKVTAQASLESASNEYYGQTMYNGEPEYHESGNK